jgi:hypothetical protein
MFYLQSNPSINGVYVGGFPVKKKHKEKHEGAKPEVPYKKGSYILQGKFLDPGAHQKAAPCLWGITDAGGAVIAESLGIGAGVPLSSWHVAPASGGPLAPDPSVQCLEGVNANTFQAFMPSTMAMQVALTRGVREPGFVAKLVKRAGPSAAVVGAYAAWMAFGFFTNPILAFVGAFFAFAFGGVIGFTPFILVSEFLDHEFRNVSVKVC